MDREIHVASEILLALDCPRALSVVILMRYGEWKQIANLSLIPTDYRDHDHFFRSYQATKLLSKARWLPTGIDTRAVAINKFELAEVQCHTVNEFWDSYLAGKLKLIPRYERFLFAVRRKIGDILGSSTFAWTSLCDFGPGQDQSTGRGFTAAYNKLNSPGDVTAQCYPLLNTFCSLTSLGYLFTGDISTRSLSVEIARGNRVTFVPKNAKTQRSIAVEPRWNIWMQKGLGAYIRKRLKFFSVNLDDQTLNQQRALAGSRDSSLCTIDLASASDTLARGVVEALLPLPWLSIFQAMRSPGYTLKGAFRPYHKWSSMGNGYTFELESMIFYAIASAVTDNVSVYGDDVIVDSDSADEVIDLLSLFGFTVNSEKTFIDGPFRESCGLDAFNGVVVTPIYWKEPLNEQGTLTLVNQISLLADRLGPTGFRFRGLKKIWKELVYQLPKRFQTRGPINISTCIHDSQEKWNATKRFGWDGCFVNVWVPISKRFRYWNFNAALVSVNFQPPVGGGYTVRDRFVWKKRTVFVPFDMKTYGPWF